MGIKRELEISQLPERYHHLELTPTSDGVSDSVYLLGDIYVLKYFENISQEVLESEINLLNSLINLPVPKIVDSFRVNSRVVVIYSQILGKSIYNPSLDNIRDIGSFLREFHNQSRDIKSNNINLFRKERLLKLILDSKYQPLLDIYRSIDIELQDDGIIHGDLFVDNAKFIDDRLSGVYDFSDASIGDFLFDLAVVAISWCYDKSILNPEKLDILLQSYKIDISFTQFKPYIKYALLYYATTRYIHNREYMELIYRLGEFK